jgi:hypothetical protein
MTQALGSRFMQIVVLRSECTAGRVRPINDAKVTSESGFTEIPWKVDGSGIGNTDCGFALPGSGSGLWKDGV